jgi:hypothetical protein
LVVVSVLAFAPFSLAADETFAGRFRCLDGEGDERFYDATATITGATLDIRVGPNALQRPIAPNGAFTLSFMVPNRRGGEMAHLDGKVGDGAITLRHSGGRATCSAVLARTAP